MSLKSNRSRSFVLVACEQQKSSIDFCFWKRNCLAKSKRACRACWKTKVLCTLLFRWRPSNNSKRVSTWLDFGIRWATARCKKKGYHGGLRHLKKACDLYLVWNIGHKIAVGAIVTFYQFGTRKANLSMKILNQSLL